MEGSIVAPPSKSYTHRAVIASALSDGKSELIDPLISDDILATIKACQSLGVLIEKKGNHLVINGAHELAAPNKPLDCGDSASTMRFMTPVTALVRGTTVLTGSYGLLKRPVGPLIDSLIPLGVHCTSNAGFPPVVVYGGGIEGGKTSLVGDMSSQFITGLLLSSPLARKNTEIKLTTRLESRPYVDLSLHIIEKHGITVRVSEDYRKYSVSGLQVYAPCNHKVIGDFSSAAFLIAAALVSNSHVKVTNLNTQLKNQPDLEFLNILKKMGVKMQVKNDSVEVLEGNLEAIEIDAQNIPDLIPIIATIACYAVGTTRITNAERLRIKESDRLASTASELKKMGADVLEMKDGLTVKGPCILKGTTINPHNDHRIAMASAVAAIGAEGKTTIFNAECVNKSYPDFFKDLGTLGVSVNTVS
ncbi:MAG: 3-phosphoshikimate 1-carboxyvinyltransferase [Candidatus Bathyarchaeota archaeon]